MSRERDLDIIRAPVITEKATLGAEHNQVTFRVASDATKPEITRAIEAVFSVNVVAVNTLKTKGKTKRFRGRIGRRPGYKKAVITLKEGDAIDVTTGI
jgi:large subunit ribosomal protein L23